MGALAYTKAELRVLYASLTRLLPPGGRPLSAEEAIHVHGLAEKTRTLIAASSRANERGAKVLEWRIPCSIAPTQNEATKWNQRSPWLFKKAKDILGAQLAILVAKHPAAHLFGGQRKRYVRVTRFTCQPKNVDEERVDAVGGKLPVDVLKHAGIVVNDSKEWLERRAHAMKTKRGNTHVLLELFETADEEVPCGPPEDGEAPPDPIPRARVKAAIVGPAAAKR